MRILNALARTNSLMSLICDQSKQTQMYQSTPFKSYMKARPTSKDHLKTDNLDVYISKSKGF